MDQLSLYFYAGLSNQCKHFEAQVDRFKVLIFLF